MAATTDSLVVDASVAAKWLLGDEEHADLALALLNAFMLGRISLVAPDYIRYEVASAVSVAAHGRQPRIPRELSKKAVEWFLRLALQMETGDAVILDAYPLVRQHGCSFYDAIYLALAQRLGLPFITADRKLYQKVGHLDYVIWIGDYLPIEV